MNTEVISLGLDVEEVSLSSLQEQGVIIGTLLSCCGCGDE